MRIPILTYQPMRIDGNDYRTNDLKALEADLGHISRAGYRIMPLKSIVRAWLDDQSPELDDKIVAIACDNGADFDFFDMVHPTAGPQRSVINLLRRFAGHDPSQPTPHVTSFVIVSPEARAILDRTCMVGRGWWTDSWWREATETGLLHVASYSWDYNHETLPSNFGVGGRRGTFLTIDSQERADFEIAQSIEYLERMAPDSGSILFAYPYGESNPFLVQEYLPNRGVELGIRAAFTSSPGFLERATNRWQVPRLVFGRDWTSPGELDNILADARTRSARNPAAVQAGAAAPSAPAEASDSDSLEACDRFIATRIAPIPGWLHRESALLTMHLARAQTNWRIDGPLLEIGVYKGKYLAALYKASQPGELVLGIDLFVGSSDARKDMAAVKSNIAKACGDASRLKLMAADSLLLSGPEVVAEAKGRKFRFISVDGGHTADVVSHDLESAYSALCPGGIIALDDVFNHLVPGVLEGVAEFFIRRKPALAPFAYCFNKLFVTTPDFHDRYLSEALSFLDQVTWLPTHHRSLQVLRQNQANQFVPRLFGHEIVSFEY